MQCEILLKLSPRRRGLDGWWWWCQVNCVSVVCSSSNKGLLFAFRAWNWIDLLNQMSFAIPGKTQHQKQQKQRQPEVPPGYLRSICVVQVRERDRGKLAQIMQWIVMGCPRPHPSCAAMPGLALSRSWNKKEKVAGEAELKFPGNSFCLMSFGCWSPPASATRPGHDDGWWIGEYS